MLTGWWLWVWYLLLVYLNLLALNCVRGMTRSETAPEGRGAELWAAFSFGVMFSVTGAGLIWLHTLY